MTDNKRSKLLYAVWMYACIVWARMNSSTALSDAQEGSWPDTGTAPARCRPVPCKISQQCLSTLVCMTTTAATFDFNFPERASPSIPTMQQLDSGEAWDGRASRATLPDLGCQYSRLQHPRSKSHINLLLDLACAVSLSTSYSIDD